MNRNVNAKKSNDNKENDVGKLTTISRQHSAAAAVGPSTISSSSTSKSHKSSNSASNQLQKENSELKQRNEDLKEQLSETELKVETLMETVILMEKRITLLEDQLRLSNSFQDLDLSHKSDKI